jgi:hypothetical protein
VNVLVLSKRNKLKNFRKKKKFFGDVKVIDEKSRIRNRSF